MRWIEFIVSTFSGDSFLACFTKHCDLLEVVKVAPILGFRQRGLFSKFVMKKVSVHMQKNDLMHTKRTSGNITLTVKKCRPIKSPQTIKRDFYFPCTRFLLGPHNINFIIKQWVVCNFCDSADNLDNSAPTTHAPRQWTLKKYNKNYNSAVQLSVSVSAIKHNPGSTRRTVQHQKKEIKLHTFNIVRQNPHFIRPHVKNRNWGF